jgi:hypothetical protein
MIKKSLFLVLTVTFLGGCATYRDVYREQLETLPQHYSQFDARLAWDTRVVGADIHIDGVVENVRYFEMENVEIWVVLRDPKGNTVSRSSSFIIPIRLKEYETAPFSLTLPALTVPGSKLVFTYRYEAIEDEHDARKWMQSFEAEVPQGL